MSIDDKKLATYSKLIARQRQWQDGVDVKLIIDTDSYVDIYDGNRNLDQNKERTCAENYTKWHNIFFKLQSAFW